MGLHTGTNVRLDNLLKNRLQHIADRTGIKAAQLIRMAVEEYCEQIEATGQVTIKVHSSHSSEKTAGSSATSLQINRAKKNPPKS